MQSQVREYWLTRGPRLFLTAVAFFVFTIVCQETLKSNSQADRLYMIAIHVAALLVASYMLYFRLADSIEGSVARSAHDFYVSCKISKLNPEAVSFQRSASHDMQNQPAAVPDALSEATLMLDEGRDYDDKFAGSEVEDSVGGGMAKSKQQCFRDEVIKCNTAPATIRSAPECQMLARKAMLSSFANMFTGSDKQEDIPTAQKLVCLSAWC